MKKVFLLLVFFALAQHSGVVLANAVTVGSVTRTGTSTVEFTLGWQNSWLVGGAPSNHDAVWVFVKFRRCDQGTLPFSHALLSTTMADHTLTAGLVFATPITTTDRLGNAGNHNTGAMIRRSTLGVGDITGQTVTLSIVGATDGATLQAGVDYDIRVYAIEMVQVPAGVFYFGCDRTDGRNRSESWLSNITSDRHRSGYNRTIDRVQVTSEAGVTFTATDNNTIIVPAAYPKGFQAFYCMKYEISAGQYVDFLNTLGGNAGNRHNTVLNTNRHTISLGAQGYTSTEPNRANNFMSYQDVLSYLDWAALRPMTEPEYEKVCIGTCNFLPGGYAWGLGTATEALQVQTPEDGDEMVATNEANMHFRGTLNINNTSNVSQGQGPLGCGIFARNANEDRVTSGSACYGAMEMSGNVWELVVNISSDAEVGDNHPYTGVWGDGRLDALGQYDVANWPSATNIRELGYRGGSWLETPVTAPVTTRFFCNAYGDGILALTGRHADVGGRGAR